MYFDLGLIIGDNLGIHSIIVFTESFSSNYSCQMCTINRNDLKFQCYEDESLLKSIDQYYMHLEVNNLSATGIKEKCVWLDVKSFNLFDQVGVDLMHDILEGCAKYIMGFILSYYIKDLTLFSLQVLNDRLFAFDFGPEKNKPCAITMDHINVENVKQSASEMLILVKYFGLIIGDLIPIDEPVWILYITLRKVLDILLSPVLEEYSIYVLKTLVAELNELYLKYSNNCLKPKFHFLVHYPSMIKKFGPVSHIWAMRYEAKHRILKICTRSTFNRRNLCLTLTIKHQLQLNEIFYKGRLCTTIDIGPRKIINSIKCKKIIYELNLDSKETLFPVTWATVKGTCYKINCIFTFDITEDNNTFKFVFVKNIYIYDSDKIIFEYIPLTTTCFNKNTCAYEVRFDEFVDSNNFISQNSMIFPIPNHINITVD